MERRHHIDASTLLAPLSFRAVLGPQALDQLGGVGPRGRELLARALAQLACKRIDLFHRRLRCRSPELLDVASEERWRDRLQGDPALTAEVAETADGAGVGPPGIRVSDLRGEEFDEPTVRPLAGVGDQGGEETGLPNI